MNWIILIIAGLFEVGWAIGLKYTEGFTRLWPTVGTITAMIISLGLLGIAMKGLPVGTAYSIWVGVGAVGTVILGSCCLESLPTCPNDQRGADHCRHHRSQVFKCLARSCHCKKRITHNKTASKD